MLPALVESTNWTLEIPQSRQADIWQQSRGFPTAWGRWNAYLNHLCQATCLDWLRAEYLPTAQVGMESAVWDLVNGSILTVDRLRIALIPTEAIDRSELEVPQEWVDIPSWAADYYLGVQIAPDCGSIAIYGFATHQQLKTQGIYDPGDRTYCLDAEDLIPDLNALWLTYPRYTASQTRSVAPFDSAQGKSELDRGMSSLDSTQVDRLIDRLGNSELVMPRLAVPFATWAVLLANPQWRQRLCQQRQTGNSPVFTQLGGWLQGQIAEVWQSIDRVLLPQQLEIAVRGTNSLDPLKVAPGNVCRAKVIDLDRGQIALAIGIAPLSDTASRISLQVHPAGGEMYLPGETQLRLLSADGSEIGKVNATVMETIQLQFRVSAGERFEIEIVCCGQTLVERFEV